MSSKRTHQRISLQADHVRLALRVRREDESRYRYAVEELQQVCNIYRTRYPDYDQVQPIGYHLAMASVDIAYRLQLARELLDDRDLGDRLSKLSDEAEQCLLRYTLALES